MTTYNKATLKTFFETNDVPTGTDYANLIDSQVNIVETAVQSMAGPLAPTELITARVSATNVNITGTLTVAGVFSAANFIADKVTTSAVVANVVSATVVNVATVSADAVYASAMRSVNGFFGSVGIVSAAGTTQGAATVLPNVINRGAGINDGTATGFAIPANRIGLTQVIVNGAASANLWPPTGGAINALGANTVFPMAANIPYAIYHITASAYAVK